MVLFQISYNIELDKSFYDDRVCTDGPKVVLQIDGIDYFIVSDRSWIFYRTTLSWVLRQQVDSFEENLDLRWSIERLTQADQYILFRFVN